MRRLRLEPILAALLFASGCAGDHAVDWVAAPDTLPAHVPPAFSAVDQWGGDFGTDQLRGKVWVAAFLPASCDATHPAVATLLELQESISAAGLLGATHLVGLVVDGEPGTAPVSGPCLGDGGADEDHWRLLAPTAEELAALLEAFGLSDDRARSSAPVRTAAVAVLDRAGRVRGYHDTRSAGSAGALTDHIRALAAEPIPVPQPADVMDPPWLPARQEAQQAAASEYQVFHDFAFEDRRQQSGIDFRHRFVEDLGRHFKEVHYDHGNGVAVADVNLDGRLDVYLTTQLGANGLWLNRGSGAFEDGTVAAGVGVDDRISVAPAFADIDNDGDPDLFVTTVRGGNLLFENDGQGRFADISKQAGVGHVGHSSGAAFFDYDRDGLLDLFVTNVGRYTTDEKGPGGYFVGFQRSFDGHLFPDRAERSLLYHNLGDNRFAEVSSSMGLIEDGWNGDPHVVDLDQDGWLDLFLIDMQGHDEYWVNDAGRGFVRRSREVFPATSFGSMGVAVFDFDNDGLEDVYTVDMHTDMFDGDLFGRIDHEKAKLPPESMPLPAALATDGNHIRGNAFYRNSGDGGFVEISDRIGAETYWPWGVSVGDLNADGFEDAFVTSSMNYPFRYHVNSVLLNERGERFRDSEFLLGVEPRRYGQTATPWFELDCSGEDREHALCAAHSGSIEVWGALGTRSAVLFDLDGDGDLDVVTNDFGSEPMVLISDLSTRVPLRFLGIRLVGTASNRSGLGARVTVRAGALEQSRVHDGKSGYLAQSDAPLYFGLGDAVGVVEVEVRWPSGRRQELVVEGDERWIEIVEPRAPDSV